MGILGKALDIAQDPRGAVANIAINTLDRTFNAMRRLDSFAVAVIDAGTEVVDKIDSSADAVMQAGKEVVNVAGYFASDMRNLWEDKQLLQEDISRVFDMILANNADGLELGDINGETKAELESMKIPVIFYEMMQSYFVIRNMGDHEEQLRLLTGRINRHVRSERNEKTRDSKIFVTGEGSSAAIPGEIAKHMAESFGPKNFTVEAERCGELLNGREILSKDAFIIMSNSGETDTAVRLAEKAKAIGARVIVITQNENSPLAKICEKDDVVVLECGKEEAIGATKSVVEQTMIIENIMGKLAGKKRHAEIDYETLATEFVSNLGAPIDPNIIQNISRARELVVVGARGEQMETALKIAETIGIKVRIIERADILHGHEETLTAGDVVLVLNPYPSKVAKIEEKIASRVPVYYIGSADLGNRFADRTIKVGRVNDDIQPLVDLAAIQNLLVRLAIYRGSNCEPNYARKVGDEVAAKAA